MEYLLENTMEMTPARIIMSNIAMAWPKVISQAPSDNNSLFSTFSTIMNEQN
ncbi:MAG TPA: hypothetical protein PK147_01585 [Saprospiraceae bacterium]|nr:hypothetical protein [Saprospiraceae bacterium]